MHLPRSPNYAAMEALFTKVSLSASEALASIPPDVFNVITSFLEPLDILSFGRTNKEMNGFMASDDIWLDKMTVLMLQYPIPFSSGCGYW